MCGRFSQNMGAHRRAEPLFRRPNYSALVKPARYNIAPTQRVPVIVQERGTRPTVGDLHWGLVPSWAKDKTAAARLINARAETIREKPSFRDAFKRRRCVVPASGFYEWKRDPAAKTRTPHYFTGADDDLPLLFAGLWDTWAGGGEPLHSFAIVTTAANRQMAAVHDRMPAILPPESWEAWLDPDNDAPDGLLSLLVPAGENVLRHWEVGVYVNDPRHEGDRCVEKAS